MLTTLQVSQIMASQRKTIPLYRQPRPNRLGTWLRELRQNKELALREVAAAVEMDQAHLSKVELGQRVPTDKQAAALARYFSIDPHQVEARRIAEKFCNDYSGNSAVATAIQILNETTPNAT
jgi:transcriptional regulator with XRE-family HTH domain